MEDILGKKTINLGLILFFMLFGTLFVMAFSTIEIFTAIYINVTLISLLIYSVILIFKFIKYKKKKV